MVNIVLLGTCDTKLDEILYLRDKVISNYSTEATLIDAGRKDIEHDAITIRQSQLLREYRDGESVSEMPRSEVNAIMADCATQAVKALYAQGKIHGIIAAGGSGGTTIASAVMRNALPIGFPKLIVSTIASGDTSPIIEETDITLMYSVVDVAGLNQVLCDILSNAGAAIAGMALSYASRNRSTVPNSKKRVGITMFGVTTPAVDAIRKHLETGGNIECYVFHATGHGGKAMERLVREGALDAVLDLTTTEICDHLTGGVMSAGPDRLEAAAKAGIPNIISVGATDMTNFGPKGTVPERYGGRLLYEHNPVVTLMRASKDESRRVGEFIARKLKEHAKIPQRVEVWLPRGGVSMLSTPGAPFADTDADSELFRAVKDGLSGTDIKVVEDERQINDMGFAKDIAIALLQKMGLRETINKDGDGV